MKSFQLEKYDKIKCDNFLVSVLSSRDRADRMKWLKAFRVKMDQIASTSKMGKEKDILRIQSNSVIMNNFGLPEFERYNKRTIITWLICSQTQLYRNSRKTNICLL